jgi:Ca2+-binding RTX toxin-like protein
MQQFFEPLESRAFLSVTLANGLLEIRGTGGHDLIEVQKRADDNVIRVEFNGAETEYPLGSVTRILIYGEAGNDRIGFSGRDGGVTTPAYIEGGNGIDRIEGSEVNDVILGGNQRDIIEGKGGRDRVVGGDGNDYLSGGGGNDILYGEAGNDDIEGGRGDDDLQGNLGDDSLNGNSGNDDFDDFDDDSEIDDRGTGDNGGNGNP